MWREMPEQRLTYVRQRQSELIAEAAADRSGGRPTHSEHGFTGLHLRLGRLLIVIGRSLYEEDALSPELVRR
jgi:hypothetical protein